MDYRAEPYEGKKPYAFVSYCRKDSELCDVLIQYMSEEGIRLWYDKGIHGGEAWTDIIAEHLDNCYVCVLLITDGFVGSKFCRRELDYADDQRKPLLPLLIKDVSLPPGMKFRIGSTQYIELSQDVLMHPDELRSICKTPLLLKCVDSAERAKREREEKEKREREEAEQREREEKKKRAREEREKREREEAERREREEKENRAREEREKREREEAERREREEKENRAREEREKREREEAEQREREEKKKRAREEREKREREEAERRKREEAARREREEAEQREREKAKIRRREQRKERIASACAWLSEYRLKIGVGLAIIAAIALAGFVLHHFTGSSEPIMESESTETSESTEMTGAGETVSVRIPEDESESAIAYVSADEASQVRAQMDELFANALTVSSDSYLALQSALENTNVSAVIISSGSSVRIPTALTITKPVLLEPEAELCGYDTLTVEGENACLYVKGFLNVNGVIRTSGGGRIISDTGSSYSTGTVWAEDAENDIVLLDGESPLADGQLVMCSENALFNKTTEVSTADELAAATGGSMAVKSITIVGNVTINASGTLIFTVPVTIAEGASLTVTGTARTRDVDNYCFLGSDACLFNYGALNATVEACSALIVNEGTWTGGLQTSTATVLNYGNMTMTSENLCAGTTEGAAQFYNEGSLLVRDGSVDFCDGVFHNRGAITVSGRSGKITFSAGVTARNSGGVITLKNYATLDNRTLFDNNDDSNGSFSDTACQIVIESGCKLINEGVLWSICGGITANGTVNNDGLIIGGEVGAISLGTNAGVYILPAGDDGYISQSTDTWTVVTTADELQEALSDSSVNNVVLRGNADISGSLSVTKPLLIAEGYLHVKKSLTVDGGYIVSDSNDTLYSKNLDVNNGFVLSNDYLNSSYVTLGSGGALYTASAELSNVVLENGSKWTALNELALDRKNSLTIQAGGQMTCLDNIWLDNCTVRINGQGLLELTAGWQIGTNVTFQSDGYIWSDGSSQVMCDVYGTIVNNGEIYAQYMDVYGTIKNNGNIYTIDTASIQVADGGEIKGSEVKTGDSASLLQMWKAN